MWLMLISVEEEGGEPSVVLKEQLNVWFFPCELRSNLNNLRWHFPHLIPEASDFCPKFHSLESLLVLAVFQLCSFDSL